MLANVPCEQSGHCWIMTDPPQFANGECAVYCYCPDCSEKRWVALPKEKFDELYNKALGHTLTKEDINIGRI